MGSRDHFANSDQPYPQGDRTSSGEEHPAPSFVQRMAERDGEAEPLHQQPAGADLEARRVEHSTDKIPGLASPLPSEVQKREELNRLLERAHAYLPSDLHSTTISLSERILERISWRRTWNDAQARLDRRLIETACYRAAHDQAIQDAYERGQIGSHTSDNELSMLGQQAGSRAVRELTDPERPRGKLFVNRTPESLSRELKQAEELSIRPLKIDEPAFKEEIHQWAREEYDGQTQTQEWIWAYTEDNKLLVLPHDVWSAEYQTFTSHTQLALGKPVKSAGAFDLAVTMTPERGIHVEAKLISNMTGHYWADAPSLYDYAPLLLEALRKAGITTESVEVEISSYRGRRNL